VFSPRTSFLAEQHGRCLLPGFFFSSSSFQILGQAGPELVIFFSFFFAFFWARLSFLTFSFCFLFLSFLEVANFRLGGNIELWTISTLIVSGADTLKDTRGQGFSRFFRNFIWDLAFHFGSPNVVFWRGRLCRVKETGTGLIFVFKFK